MTISTWNAFLSLWHKCLTVLTLCLGYLAVGIISPLLWGCLHSVLISPKYSHVISSFVILFLPWYSWSDALMSLCISFMWCAGIEINVKSHKNKNVSLSKGGYVIISVYLHVCVFYLSYYLLYFIMYSYMFLCKITQEQKCLLPKGGYVIISVCLSVYVFSFILLLVLFWNVQLYELMQALTMGNFVITPLRQK